MTNSLLMKIACIAFAGALGDNGGGAIVNVSSIAGLTNFPFYPTYSASKAAVRSFDEALGREARRRKIRVIDARPPHTETGLADRAIEGRAPSFPSGLAPTAVAAKICEAIATGGVTELPSEAFTS